MAKKQNRFSCSCGWHGNKSQLVGEPFHAAARRSVQRLIGTGKKPTIHRNLASRGQCPQCFTTICIEERPTFQRRVDEGPRSLGGRARCMVREGQTLKEEMVAF